MLKRFLSASLILLLLLVTPISTALAAGADNGGASLMEGPFVILAFATIIIMIYYCFRD
ncbi:hypothetical protein J2S74_003187 [Evansella vedderi]|uniref:Uncharacterized protein n=1 Tax=Evansella vedderi TaxID=38282 RepID=A0ABU0A0E2_9BACI|nr:hypothetical protein [Evansella vedderi]MDQ0255805.1 hypothetical protein [Evansella vedderi]